MSFKKTYDIACLESEELGRLFNEMTSCAQYIRIEEVVIGGSHRYWEEHPASTVGLTIERPTIQFIHSLDRKQKIEVIAHELAHLLLVYRYELGVIGLRTPHPGNSEEIFRFCMNMNREWNYMLGQIINTVHHLILIDYLKEEYGIVSSLHHQLLHRHLCRLAREEEKEKEPLFAKGVIAFEYERLVGKVDNVLFPFRQTDSFWEAYYAAKKYFGIYSFESIPSPKNYENDILSFLENLGYPREDFIFFPGKSIMSGYPYKTFVSETAEN